MELQVQTSEEVPIFSKKSDKTFQKVLVAVADEALYAIRSNCWNSARNPIIEITWPVSVSQEKV